MAKKESPPAGNEWRGTRDPAVPEKPRENWTKEERMGEFAATGNPKHLTPELAKEMGVVIGEDGKMSIEETASQVAKPAEAHAVPSVESILNAPLKTFRQSFERNFPAEDGPVPSLPYETVAATVERLAKELSSKSLRFEDVAFRILHSPQDPTRDERNTQVFKSYVEAAKCCPEYLAGLHELENIIGQDAQVIDPKIYVSGVADIVWRGSVDPSLKDTILASFNYQYAFFPGHYREALLEGLDFEHPKQYAKTAGFLEFLKALYNTGSEEAYSEDLLPEPLITTLRAAVEKEGGSYLLKTRARELLESMEQNDWSGDDSPEVFRIAPGRWAFRAGGSVMLAPIEQAAEVQRKLHDWEGKKEKMDAHAREVMETTGTDFVMLPREMVHEEEASWSSLLSEFQKPLSVDDLTSPRPDRTDEERERAEEDLFDYAYLVSAATRSIVERELGVDPTSLSLKEQYYLLNFLKGQRAETVVAVRELVERYGKSALSVFLFSEYDPYIIERVLTFAALTEEEAVQEAFDRCATTLAAAQSFTENLAATESPRTTLALRTRFAEQVQESFVRRFFSLFYGAEKMSTYWYDAMTGYRSDSDSMTDLLEAFRGIELMTRILADIGHGNDFEFSIDKERTRGDNVVLRARDRATGATYPFKAFIRPRAEIVRRSARKGIAARTQELEARINFELSFDELPPEDPLRKTFTNRTDYLDEHKSVETSAVRFAFDLDTAYDPPRISFDMGRNARRSAHQARTGDALGRILDTIAAEGHHLTASFDQSLSGPETFAALAEEFRAYLAQAGNRAASSR